MFSFFFFNDTATTEIYTLSLHDALPISHPGRSSRRSLCWTRAIAPGAKPVLGTGARSFGRNRQNPGKCHDAIVRSGKGCTLDRKSTRLNSSHGYISYAVFCLKKKKKQHN